MRTLKYVVLAGLLGAAVSVQAHPVTYKLDPNHTMVLFSWSHFGYSHPTADLGLGEGKLVFDAQHPANSSVEVTLPLSKLDTHVTALDAHLKEADFFDADKYPVVSFKSTKVQALGSDKFKVTGNLTVHGMTKVVVLDATLNKLGAADGKIGFDATASLNRSDFGVARYVPAVSDQITIRITTEGATAKAAAK